ncbi:B3 DNA binding domain-containing protein [Cynara cardunculus var. scolymus]|uniref:B3 DNA binding domain-containing protein n=1 Tax=Cynara cardunculus var. scolymus TaxID=59895 RepID=A0A118K1S3_CYNCS|nr:B3 DNA binding domain-containing protein [Cynara cardunculus var. scolymus]
MEPEVCMNGLCGALLAAEGDYKKGWALRSGGFANLCDKCGSAYEQLAFCEVFHLDDTGWRECTSCGRRLHCGCIASSAFLELLDNGGVSCISCSSTLGHNPKTREEKTKETGISVENSVGETRSSSIDNHVNVGNLNKIMLTKLNDGEELLIPSENAVASTSQMKLEEYGTTPMSLNGTSESPHAAGIIKYRESTGLKDVYGSLVQTNLTIGLSAAPGKPVLCPSTAVEETELNKTFSSFQQGTWSRHLLPKVPKSILPQGFNANPGMSSQIRVARPPVEGRVKNQLLPRYWPRITEQELQQISGDSNATIVPLFEKVLSASDAGRIGRLVLPKACAEAYFPPISQPEGLPLRIQDVKGKEWLFQFRFWPNNNSRMYVLEGVTPCIQSMQLQAGDTVTFSRMEPEGKLLMGFRKASTSTSLQLMKGSTYSHLSEFSRNVNLPNGDVGWHTNEQLGSKLMAGSFPPSEKKRSRNIGSKSKRLLIESQDALEIKHTWEESQDMLFPSPLQKPSVVTIEDNEFEEYEEPPVFGKGSIFTVCSSGRKSSVSHKPEQNQGYSGIDAQTPSTAEPSAAITTKHPRHRPGCSCIVCIQPPSGKGKHNPTCTCNVCMTVKRRFKTLMLRKKKRQSEHEAKIAEKNQLTCGPPKEDVEVSISVTPHNQLCYTLGHKEVEVGFLDNESSLLGSESTSKGHLDLNIHPHREERDRANGETRVSMMSLLQVANLPLETYLKQNGLTSLISEQQASSGSQTLPQETGETGGGDEEEDDRLGDES